MSAGLFWLRVGTSDGLLAVDVVVLLLSLLIIII
jgi:hypothetical protein